METAVCIGPSSGGGRFVYMNLFFIEIVGGDGALREVINGNSKRSAMLLQNVTVLHVIAYAMSSERKLVIVIMAQTWAEQ
jgi:hypothetical protein